MNMKIERNGIKMVSYIEKVTCQQLLMVKYINGKIHREGDIPPFMVVDKYGI